MTYLERLEEEYRALQVQLVWFRRVSIAIGLLSLPGAMYSLWVPVGGLFLAFSLAGIAWYIGTVHLQSTRERIESAKRQGSTAPNA